MVMTWDNGTGGYDMGWEEQVTMTWYGGTDGYDMG